MSALVTTPTPTDRKVTDFRKYPESLVFFDCLGFLVTLPHTGVCVVRGGGLERIAHSVFSTFSVTFQTARVRSSEGGRMSITWKQNPMAEAWLTESTHRFIWTHADLLLVPRIPLSIAAQLSSLLFK